MSEMTKNSEEVVATQNRFEAFGTDATYDPDLAYAEGFNVSSVFDCSRQMKNYSGDVDYHSLMHNVQKPMLASHKVEELSFFANKLLLRRWVNGLIPIQKVFGFSSGLNDESDIQRLFQVIASKVENSEEFMIKPINGSESIGTLKVYRSGDELKSQFLGRKKGYRENIDGRMVLTNYELFNSWISEVILGVTSGTIDTHLRYIEPGLVVQELFPHDKSQRGPIEMKYFTAWGELLFVGCRNGNGVHFGRDGEHLEGDSKSGSILHETFFHDLKKVALSLARASTYPNLRCDFFVDIESGKWVLNETETLADCRSHSGYLLNNTGKFYLKGWIDRVYVPSDAPLTVSVLRERLISELKVQNHP